MSNDKMMSSMFVAECHRETCFNCAISKFLNATISSFLVGPMIVVSDRDSAQTQRDSQCSHPHCDDSHCCQPKFVIIYVPIQRG